MTDERFHGVDPEARESISVPLRVGDKGKLKLHANGGDGKDTERAELDSGVRASA
mgnify:CR=1 FL=1